MLIKQVIQNFNIDELYVGNSLISLLKYMYILARNNYSLIYSRIIRKMVDKCKVLMVSNIKQYTDLIKNTLAYIKKEGKKSFINFEFLYLTITTIPNIQDRLIADLLKSFKNDD